VENLVEIKWFKSDRLFREGNLAILPLKVKLLLIY
jgi:hypothetical protein